jgi:hypothetical protein
MREEEAESSKFKIQSKLQASSSKIQLSSTTSEKILYPAWMHCLPICRLFDLFGYLRDSTKRNL